MPVYAVASLCSAFLLFVVQPMFAKTSLPILGGSPAVWTTCMLFFQCGLLTGYCYSHALTRFLSVRRQVLVHTGTVGLAGMALPIDLPSDVLPTNADPVWWLLGAAALSVGPPFIVLASSAPLLQRWFSTLRHRHSFDPYFLYAASNAGSLAGLALYPTVIEPYIAGTLQAVLWTAGYTVYAVLTLACAVLLWRRGAPTGPHAQVRSSVSITRRLWWVCVAFVPSSLMLAVTAHLSMDVAPVPLMWTAPLAIYLITFILAFSRLGPSASMSAGRLLPYFVLVLVWMLVTHTPLPFAGALVLHLLGLFVIATRCHCVLASDRPAPEHLTTFYLALAVGGVLGGVFNTLGAPRLFTGVTEYPLLVATASLVVGRSRLTKFPADSGRFWLAAGLAGALAAIALATSPAGVLRTLLSGAFFGAAIVTSYTILRRPVQFAAAMLAIVIPHGTLARPDAGELLYASRTFFGVYRVSSTNTGEFVSLFHGTTVHGRQRRGELRPEPLTYYHLGSPIADVLRARPRDGTRRIGVVGLGVGSLAAYAAPGDRWDFFEIDPEIERIAADQRFFTFLSACGLQCRVVLGDGRLSLAKGAEQYDVVVLDAFSSDAIPLHLLTREALDVYLSRLAPRGVLAFHISSNHLRLRPVLARLARDHGLNGWARIDDVPVEAPGGASSSEWVVLTRHGDAPSAISDVARWERLTADSAAAWSDDFSNIWSVIDWRR